MLKIRLVFYFLLILGIAGDLNAERRKVVVLPPNSVSGMVTLNSAGLEGVLITVTADGGVFGSSAATVTTDALGGYSLPLPPGGYVVTPSKEGYTFSPTDRHILMAGDDVTGVDFAAQSAASPTPEPTPTTEPTVPPCSIDSDSDGTQDCTDSCPADPGKTSAGTCGCGTPDADADGDQVADCMYNGDPLPCGEPSTVFIEQLLMGDNNAMGQSILDQGKKLKRLVKAVAARFGGEEGKRLSQLVSDSSKLVTKVRASTSELIARFPVVLVACPGNEGSAEVSNADEKNEMRANSTKLLKMGQRVSARLLFYQTVRSPLTPPTKAQVAKFKAERRQSEALMKRLYERIIALIAKVPDISHSS